MNRKKRNFFIFFILISMSLQYTQYCIAVLEADGYPDIQWIDDFDTLKREDFNGLGFMNIGLLEWFSDQYTTYDNIVFLQDEVPTDKDFEILFVENNSYKFTLGDNPEDIPYNKKIKVKQGSLELDGFEAEVIEMNADIDGWNILLKNSTYRIKNKIVISYYVIEKEDNKPKEYALDFVPNDVFIKVEQPNTFADAFIIILIVTGSALTLIVVYFIINRRSNGVLPKFNLRKKSDKEKTQD